eukprot:6659482-Prymnesium_polylepis.3
MALVPARRAAPPRVTFSKQDLIGEVLDSQEGQHSIVEAQAMNMSVPAVETPLTLFINNFRLTDATGDIECKIFKQFLLACNMSAHSAKDVVQP